MESFLLNFLFINDCDSKKNEQHVFKWCSSKWCTPSFLWFWMLCSRQDIYWNESCSKLVSGSSLSLSLSSGIAVGLANPVSLDELPLLSRLSKRLSFSSFLRHYEDLVLLCRLRLSCHQSVTLKWFLVKESKQPHPFYHCLSFDNPLSRKMRKKLFPQIILFHSFFEAAWVE